MRKLLYATALLAALGPWCRSPAAVNSEIIPETTALRHGLTRAWFTQVTLDRGRARVRDMVLYKDMLYVQTDHAVVHALSAETGETVWVKQVGRHNHPSLTSGASQDLLAVVNGSRLYVVNRYNGDLLYEIQVDGAPGAGAALSEKRAYVPMVNGMVKAYRLEPLTDPQKELGMIKKDLTEEQKETAEEYRRENLRLRQEYIPPLACQSSGRALVQPLVTEQNEGEEFVAWPTDRGYLNIGWIDRRSEDALVIKFSVEADAGIDARPTYLPPDPNHEGESGIVYGASKDGFVHAVEVRTGEPLWRFSAGDPLIQPPVVIDQYVYMATQPGGMFCLDSQSGVEVWWTPHVRQFIAASKHRIYAADKLGRILILNAKTGARLDTLPAGNLPLKLINADTDRLYLGTRTGLIQCLHEVELPEPLRHLDARNERLTKLAKPETRQADELPAPGPKKPAEPEYPPGSEDPFGGGEDPFGGGGAGDGDAGGNGAGGGDDAGGGGDPFGGGAGGGDDAGGDDDPFS